MKRRTAGLLSALCISVDLVVKNWVENALPFEVPVPVMPFLSFYRTWNEGIAFSFLSSLNDWVLVAVTVAIILFLLWLWRQTPKSRWLSQIGFALVFGGAIGNLVDRAFLGHVIDFIMVHTQTWSFAIFNLADSFISVGAAAIVLDEILTGIRQRKSKT